MKWTGLTVCKASKQRTTPAGGCPGKPLRGGTTARRGLFVRCALGGVCACPFASLTPPQRTHKSGGLMRKAAQKRANTIRFVCMASLAAVAPGAKLQRCAHLYWTTPARLRLKAGTQRTREARGALLTYAYLHRRTRSAMRQRSDPLPRNATLHWTGLWCWTAPCENIRARASRVTPLAVRVPRENRQPFRWDHPTPRRALFSIPLFCVCAAPPTAPPPGTHESRCLMCNAAKPRTTGLYWTRSAGALPLGPRYPVASVVRPLRSSSGVCVPAQYPRWAGAKRKTTAQRTHKSR